MTPLRFALDWPPNKPEFIVIEEELEQFSFKSKTDPAAGGR